MRHLTIGILAETKSNIFNWARTRSLLETKGVRIVWFEETPSNRPHRKFRTLPARLAWRVLNLIENRKFRTPYRQYKPDDAISLACHFQGHFKDFEPQALDRIRSESVDLIIRIGGRGIYRDDILNTPGFGLISIHHGDNREYRGGPPGFWEVINRSETCGFIVQRLTKTLDGGEVMARGAVSNSGIVVCNQSALFSAADEALANVIASILETQHLPVCEPPTEQLGPIYKLPRLRELWRYLMIRASSD